MTTRSVLIVAGSVNEFHGFVRSMVDRCMSRGFFVNHHQRGASYYIINDYHFVYCRNPDDLRGIPNFILRKIGSFRSRGDLREINDLLRMAVVSGQSPASGKFE